MLDRGQGHFIYKVKQTKLCPECSFCYFLLVIEDFLNAVLSNFSIFILRIWKDRQIVEHVHYTVYLFMCLNLLDEW